MMAYGEHRSCPWKNKGSAGYRPLQGLGHELLWQGSLGKASQQSSLPVNASLPEPGNQLAQRLACRQNSSLSIRKAIRYCTRAMCRNLSWTRSINIKEWQA